MTAVTGSADHVRRTRRNVLLIVMVGQVASYVFTEDACPGITALVLS